MDPGSIPGTSTPLKIRKIVQINRVKQLIPNFYFDGHLVSIIFNVIPKI